MRILAIKWRRLGDTVLWTSALDALRQWSPGAEIDLAVSAPYSGLFRGDARFANVFGLERPAGAMLRIGRELRRRRYDLVLNFHASERSLFVSLLARGRERVVHHHSRRPRNFMSQRKVINLGKVMPANERDLNVVRALGWNGTAPATSLHVSPADVEAAAARLSSIWGAGDERPLVLLGTAASRPAKQWPLEHYAALARLLGERARVGIVYDDESVFAGNGYLRDRLAREARLIATPSLAELTGLLRHAACYAGSDSGVKHVACAVGTKTVTFFGPESLGEWHFYGAPHSVIRKAVLCRDEDPEPPEFSWCGRGTCPYASHACLSLITPEEAAQEIGCQL